jgi:DnaJ-class molecular chaperone
MTNQLETCPRCHGYGVEVTSESNDQYDRTHQQTDTCRMCGGEGAVWLDEEECGLD